MAPLQANGDQIEEDKIEEVPSAEVGRVESRRGIPKATLMALKGIYGKSFFNVCIICAHACRNRLI